MMWSSSIHLFLFFWVCRVCVYVCVCTCMCVYECLHICEQMCGCGYRYMYVGMHLEVGSWGLELFFINFLPCSWDRVSQSNPEVDGITNLTSQPTLAMLSLPSEAKIPGGLAYSPFGLYMGSGDLNFGPHVFQASPLSHWTIFPALISIFSLVSAWFYF